MYPGCHVCRFHGADVDAETFLPKRIAIDLSDSDFDSMSGALMDVFDIQDNVIDLSDVEIDVNDFTLEYAYDYDKDVDISVPEEASEKAKKLTNIKETITKESYNASNGSTSSSSQTPSTSTASASASASASATAGTVYVPPAQPADNNAPSTTYVIEDDEPQQSEIYAYDTDDVF